MAAIFEARGGDSRVETAIALPRPPAAFFAAAAATLAGCVVLTATLRALPLLVLRDLGGMTDRRIL